MIDIQGSALSNMSFDYGQREFTFEKWAEQHPVAAFNFRLFGPLEQRAFHGESDISNVRASMFGDQRSALGDVPDSVESGPAMSEFWLREDVPRFDYQSQGAGSPFVDAPAMGPVTVEHVHQATPLDYLN